MVNQKLNYLQFVHSVVQDQKGHPSARRSSNMESPCKFIFINLAKQDTILSTLCNFESITITKRIVVLAQLVCISPRLMLRPVNFGHLNV